MKNVIPRSGKVAKDAKECVQECVSEFISFITSEACDRCINASVFYLEILSNKIDYSIFFSHISKFFKQRNIIRDCDSVLTLSSKMYQVI